MARTRKSTTTAEQGVPASTTTEGEITMSDLLFEPLSEDEWREEGGGGAAERGLYTTVLTEFAKSGQRYARLSMDKGRFAGKKAASVSTSLKNARDGKNADAALASIRISSRGENKEKGISGVVFLENSAVEA